jgi:type I site-specific restriction-modification system R (restriction) subunit
MRSVDMAVVVSQSQNEIDDLKQKGLDILPHRERMQKQDLESKFKDDADPLRLVFVCAMWITGFDVPTCSTMYLDKPMKNHTLMQTIARANRRAPGKTSGVIVDYVGVFQNLQKALAIYASKETAGHTPIQDKDELVAELEVALAEARKFCTEHGVNVDAIFEGVAITAPIIEGDKAGGRVDLSSIDFEKLATLFAQRPRTAAERLHAEAEKKAHELVAQNPTRIHLVEKLEKLVEAYNLNTADVEAFFEALKRLIAEMEEEERRAAREGLTEEELAIFDLLTKPEPKLTKAQEVEVKKVAHDLLLKLHDQLSFDWRKTQETRGAVHSAIRFTLDELPQEPYPEAIWENKVDAVWAYIFNSSAQRGAFPASTLM